MRGAPPVALQAALLAGLVPPSSPAARSRGRATAAHVHGEAAAVAALRRPLHVEIAARFVYEAGPEDEEAVQVAEAIYRAGVEKFPASAAPLLAYAQARPPPASRPRPFPASPHARPTVLLHVQRSPSSGTRGFVIYRKDSSGSSPPTPWTRYHRLAVRSVRKFWGTLAAARARWTWGAGGDPRPRRRRRAPRPRPTTGPPRPPRPGVLNDEAAAQSFFEQADACEDARLAEAAGAALGEGAWEGPAPGSHPNAPSVASRNSLVLASAGQLPPALLERPQAAGPPAAASSEFAEAGGARRHPGRASLLASAALGFFARRLVRPGPASAKYEAAGGRDSPAFSNSPGLSPRSRSGSALPSFVAQPPRSFGASSGGRGAGPGAVAPAPTGSVRLSRSVALSNGPAAVMGPAEGPGEPGAPPRGGRLGRRGRGPASLRSLAETRRDASAAAGAEGARRRHPTTIAIARSRRRRRRMRSADEPGPDPEDSEPASEAELERALAIGRRGARARGRARSPARASRGTRAPPRRSRSRPAGPSSSPSTPSRLPRRCRCRRRCRGRAAWGAPAGDADAEAGPSASKHKTRGRGRGGEGASGLAALARILDLDAYPCSRGPRRPRAPARGPPPRSRLGGSGGAGRGRGGSGGRSSRMGAGRGYSEQERGRRERRWVKVKRRLQGTALAHDASIRRMKRTVVAVLVAVFALAVAAFVVVGDLVRDYEQGIKQTGASGSRRKNAVLLALNAQSLLLAGVLPSTPRAPRGTGAEALAAAADELEARHLSGRGWRWTRALHGLRIFKNDEGEVADVVEPLWVAGLQLVSNGRRVARAPLAALRNASHAQRELFFLRENGPRLYDAFNAATALVDERAYKSFLNIRVFLIAMFRVGDGPPPRPRLRSLPGHPRASAKRLARRGRRGQDPSAANESEAGRRAPAPRAFEFEAEGRRQRRGDSLADFDDLELEAADAAGEREREGRDRRRRRSSLLKGAPAPAGDAKPDLEAAAAQAPGPARPPPRRPRPRLRRDPVTLQARPGPAPPCRPGAAEAGLRGGRGAQYAGAFLLLWALFLVWFAVGFETSTSCETFSTERNFAGLLRSLPVRVAFHAARPGPPPPARRSQRPSPVKLASQLALGAGDYAEQRAMLGHSIDRLERVHRSLLFGNRSAHLNGAIHRYHPPTGEGLQAQLLRFLEEARVLHASRPGHVGPGSEAAQAVEGAIKGPLQPGLQRLADLFVEEATLRLEAFLALQTAMFAAVVALLLLEYLFVFRRIIGTLTDESRRTLFMFLMLPRRRAPPPPPRPRASTGAALRRAPRQVIEATESIKAHLFRLLSRWPRRPRSPASHG
eukprot:tig00021489_g21705.t1